MLAAALFALCSLGFAEPPSDSAIAAAADRLATQALAKPGAAGLQIAVARNGKFIVDKGYGLAELEHDAKTDENALFRIGSITKQFTAAAVMKLVEQGKIGLDDSITKYLPEYNTQGRAITIRHLLTHTSGIKSYTELKRVMVEEPEHEFTHQEMIDMVQNEPLAFEPGTKFAYCNTGYYLLGVIVERVSGKSYCELLQDEFFGPLQLSHTRCDSNSDIIKGRAQGYRGTGKKQLNDQGLAVGTPFAAGILIASAHDLVTWSDALASGKVVSAASYQQMTTPFELEGGQPDHYGFGLGTDEFEGHARVQHGGGIFGFNSMLERFPNDGLTIAVLSNSEAVSSDRVAQALSREALGIAEQPAISVPLPAADAKRCEGTYNVARAKLDITIAYRDGSLFAQGSGQPEFGLIYTGNGEFRASFDDAVRLVFDLSGDNPVQTFTLHQNGAALKATRK
jgi:CubicO group peptidase (beta-lactamase class C family)